MKRIIKREGLPKVVQIVTPSSGKARLRQLAKPFSLAGALGKRRLVRRALRATNNEDGDPAA